MDISTVQRRIAALPPLAVDSIGAVGLTALAWVQLWAFLQFRPERIHVPNVEPVPLSNMTVHPFVLLLDQGPERWWLPFIVAALAFLPLAVRRRWPWAAMTISGTAALLYTIMPWPPVFVVIGPMIAIYTLAQRSKTRRAWLVTLGLVALMLALPALYYAQARWVVESVGTFALLAAAAFLGDTARTRRDYIAAVEQRARDAERTREEEARRRVDEERLRIAREVHDIVAHSLSIVTVQAAAADALVDDDPARAHESLAHIRSTSKQALSELRSMLGVLRTSEPAAPLSPAADLSRLDALVAQVREAGIAVEVDAPDGLGGLPAATSLSAYRIVQEALTNVVRHSQARSATVRVTRSATELTVAVSDDGIGEKAAGGDGHGVRGMAERAEALGGSLQAGPRAGGAGWLVCATLPLNREATR